MLLCLQMWYSFDAGLAHFISYSTEVYFTDGQVYVARQYEWLQQDLAEANRLVPLVGKAIFIFDSVSSALTLLHLLSY